MCDTIVDAFCFRLFNDIASFIHCAYLGFRAENQPQHQPVPLQAGEGPAAGHDCGEVSWFPTLYVSARSAIASRTLTDSKNDKKAHDDELT